MEVKCKAIGFNGPRPLYEGNGWVDTHAQISVKCIDQKEVVLWNDKHRVIELNNGPSKWDCILCLSVTANLSNPHLPIPSRHTSKHLIELHISER